MRGYLFDTMVHVIACDSVPEKWRRQWKEIQSGNKSLFLFEPLIAEIFYQLYKIIGDKHSRERIFWLRALENTKIVELDDEMAFEAGRLQNEFNGISLVDAFSLTIAKRKGAKIFTSDRVIRDAARNIEVDVDYLPKELLRQEKAR